MRLSTQISLTAVVALVALLSLSTPSTEAMPTPPVNRRPHISSSSSHTSALVRRSSFTSYDQHRVVRVEIHSEDQLKTLTENEDPLQFDYFTHQKIVGGHIDIRIPPEHFAHFQALKLDYKTVIENLQTVLDEEHDENEVYQQKWETAKVNKVSSMGETVDAFASAGDWFAGYHSYQDHQTWLSTQIKNHASIASAFSAGKTFQGREQAGIKIGSGANNVVLHGNDSDHFAPNDELG